MLLDAAALSPSSALDDPVSAAVSSELQARRLRVGVVSSVSTDLLQGWPPTHTKL